MKRREVAKTNRRKKELEEHIRNSQNNPEVVELKLTPEEEAIKEACSKDNTFNAPMLVAWMLKHFDDEVISTEGLGFLLKHLESGEGCYLLHRQGILNAVYKIQFYFFKTHPNIQILILKVFAKLLDCNYTRGTILKDTDMLRVVFTICHFYMNSKSHVDLCLYCMMQCTRSELNRATMLQERMVGYIVTFIRRYPLVPTILRSMIKLFNWISTSQERMEYLVKLKAPSIVIQCLKKHNTNRDILAPGIMFLSRAAMAVPEAFETILRKKAVPVIIYALKIVYDDEVIQLEGLKLLQILSHTSEGWKQISDIKGGWQSITAGTSLGDDLIHDLPGGFNNPGYVVILVVLLLVANCVSSWCIGETPYLPILDRMKIQAAKLSINSLQAEPKASWTSFSLTEYMGLSLKAKTLAINTEYQDIQFDLISTLDLLPTPNEEKERWFMRVKEFEKENGVKIEDMIATVQELRRREVITKNREAGIVEKAEKTNAEMDDRFVNELANEIVPTKKELYVMGTKITGDGLAEADMSIDEMRGIV